MKRILFFVTVLLLSGAGIAYVSYTRGGGNISFLAQLWNWSDTVDDNKKSAEGEQDAVDTQPAEFSHENGRYVNSAYGFSFELSPEYEARVTTLGGEGDVFTFDAGGEKSFQIFIMPHDEPAVNEERIKIDVPDIVMKHVRVGTLADTEVLVFNSSDSSVGDIYEIWFVHDGHLYQIMTYEGNTANLNTILSSWKFEK